MIHPLGVCGRITTKQVDCAIESCLQIAYHFERLRDECRFESAEYWRWQDKAMLSILAAETFMPGQGGAF